MYSHRTQWIEVEEVTRNSKHIVLGPTDELSQTCKYVKVISKDDDIVMGDIYIIPVNAMNRKKVSVGYGVKTRYFVHRDMFLVHLLDARDKYSSLIDIKGKNVEAEHWGLPRLEYI